MLLDGLSVFCLFGIPGGSDIGTPMLEVAVVVPYQTALYHMPGMLFQMIHCQLFALLTAHLHIFLSLENTNKPVMRDLWSFFNVGNICVEEVFPLT